jgi:excisionase family DNA binding protein
MVTEFDFENRLAKLEQSLFLVKSILSFDEAAEFLHLSKSYLYKLTSAGQIPHYKPKGKMLYFEKASLEDWLRQNPVKTVRQMEQEASELLRRKQQSP